MPQARHRLDSRPMQSRERRALSPAHPPLISLPASAGSHKLCTRRLPGATLVPDSRERPRGLWGPSGTCEGLSAQLPAALAEQVGDLGCLSVPGPRRGPAPRDQAVWRGPTWTRQLPVWPPAPGRARREAGGAPGSPRPADMAAAWGLSGPARRFLSALRARRLGLAAMVSAGSAAWRRLGSAMPTAGREDRAAPTWPGHGTRACLGLSLWLTKNPAVVSDVARRQAENQDELC